ncbi:hypothetical protein M413DRAFT_447812 [Hebeloma cylindrosporum]|uniref:Inhibitor I9 domain-containing protein n=1 Tax=Hebeloma cylindrosporum TaxID=76867 RepID=A0A0C2YBA9_HEBCY|nr:hypothetical protein M413DRAFT_447812 [Hebeloma cylindrosporum h7]
MSSGRYIVVFNDNVTSDDITKYADDVKKNGGQVDVRYDETGGILNGFAAKIPDSFLENLKSLQGDVIKYIEVDSVVTTQ